MSPKTDAAHRQIEQTVHIEQTGQIVRCKPVKKPIKEPIKKPSRRSEWEKRAGPQDIFRRNMIESKYHARGYRSATELCKDRGVKDKGLSRHLLGDTPYRLDELELLDSILNFTDIELAQIVRGRDESKN